MGAVRSTKSIQAQLAREKARRYYQALAPADRDAEIERHLIDISQLAIDTLISTATADPFQQETQLRHLEHVADELAGPNATAQVRFLARTIAVLSLERDLADHRHYSILREPDLFSSQFGRDVLRWRDSTQRSINRVLRTLAYVMHVDVVELESRLTKTSLRVVG